MIFGELHWKKDVIRKIEDLLVPENISEQALIRSEDDPNQPRFIRVRNIYYIKARNTLDEYLTRMVYRADSKLWEQIEHMQVANSKNNNKE